MTRMHFGVITAARPPDDALNINKYQYEYDVDVDVDVGTKMPARHVIRQDMFGSLDEYDDNTLRPGNRVMILFPNDTYANGVIVGCLRNTGKKMLRTLGAYRETRFNKVTQTIDKDGHWTLKLDQGETIKVDKKKITITNSTGEEMVFDKDAKSILVKAGKDWKATLGGNMQVTATENVVVNCKNANVTASENVSIKGAKKVSVEAEEASIKGAKKVSVEASEVEVKGSKKTTIKGGEIIMNEGLSPITTVLDHLGVVDLITGTPVKGVVKIRAG